MKRFLLELTPECEAAVREAAVTRGQSRNAFVEDALWQYASVRRAAKNLEVTRRPRRQPGRPPAKKEGE